MEYEIRLKSGATPCRLRHARALNAARDLTGKKCILELEAAKIMSKSGSDWASALHMVPKTDGGWRTTTDFKPLNAMIEKDGYPVKHIMTFQNRLRGCKIFSVKDLKKGYHQIPIKKSHQNTPPPGHLGASSSTTAWPWASSMLRPPSSG